MKKLWLFIGIFICSYHSIVAQKIETFYDFNWKVCSPEAARFYSEMIHTDSGWLRNDYFLGTSTLQMTGLFEDSTSHLANGNFRYYYANGRLESFGKSVHNKKEGLWFTFYEDGSLKDSVSYLDGEPAGVSMSWYSNGYLSDSVVHHQDGTAVQVKWHTNGRPSAAGRLLRGEKNGIWVYYHFNGQLAARIQYDSGKIVNEAYFDDSGKPQEKAGRVDEKASFSGGLSSWQKYILKNIYFPSQYKLKGSNSVTVVVSATIDEEGNIIDCYVKIPFAPPFDKIALDAVKKSPRWNPAIENNRAIVQVIMQPITFGQPE